MDDILDFDWVLSHETQIIEEEATLFQKCTSMDFLLINSAMLFENNIPFQIKHPKPDKGDPLLFGSINEIHINENDFEKAEKLLDQLLNKDSDYPKKISTHYTLEELKSILELNTNPYQGILLNMELERRGITFEDLNRVETKENEEIDIFRIALWIIFILGLIIKSFFA